MKEFLEELTNVFRQNKEFETVLKTSKNIQNYYQLPGDASTRKYYRVTLKNKKTFIIMKTDPFHNNENSYPFLVIQKHLAYSNVEVPTVYDWDAQKGIILLEDLGDTTFLKKLQSINTIDQERHLYERAIDGLINLQIFSSPGKNTAHIEAYELRFDVEKLMWEVQFAFEHFFKGLLKRIFSASDMQIFLSAFREICEILESQPVVFTHRDFHSRNIMISPIKLVKKLKEKPELPKLDDRLVFIDFQDARMGPPQYDLVSLLRDSYYQLDENQVERLVDYYIVRWDAKTGEKIHPKTFRKIFDLMTVQRNFKAIGSFASFYQLRGNPIYLKYIGNSFENIRRTLQKHKKYHSLKEVLFYYYNF
ncbi:MAG: phosphotransferase [Deltaproteobacteria bacterium]|nr:phosphotransferase [Deltaproteobacteria bacterium]